MGPGRTSTVRGCLVRQVGCGWPDTTTTNKKSTAHSNVVAEQVLTYGLVERTAWLLLFVNVSVMDLVTRDLDVYRIRDQERLSQVLAPVFPSTVHLV